MLMACQLVDCLIERMLRCQKKGKAIVLDIVLDYLAAVFNNCLL